MARRIYKHLNHETPHWVDADADYFLTLCANPRGKNHFCTPDVGKELLKAIQIYHDKQFWYCHVGVLMPDHIHLLVAFPPDKILSQVVGLWKQAVSRKLSVSWQRNFFEHRLRNEENFGNKCEYILHNPVRAGLVEHAEDWPYTWTPEPPPSETKTPEAATAKPNINLPPLGTAAATSGNP